MLSRKRHPKIDLSRSDLYLPATQGRIQLTRSVMDAAKQAVEAHQALERQGGVAGLQSKRISASRVPSGRKVKLRTRAAPRSASQRS